jgi:hypothetical protein
MELVKKDGTINTTSFRCLVKNENYRIIETRSTFKGNNPWKDSVWNAIDIVKRSDGEKKGYTREQLSRRFKNICSVQENIR